MKRSLTVIDHRGREFSLDRPARKIARDDLQADVWKRVSGAVNRGYFGRHGWRAYVLLGLIGGFAYWSIEVSPYIVRALGGQRMAGWWGWVFPSFFGLVLGLLVWGALALEKRLAAKRLWHALLGEHHCPKCLYALTGLRKEEDGCTVCPECGAAWRLRV